MAAATARAQRHLSSTLIALSPHDGPPPAALLRNHPSFWSAPDHWKFEPDLESAARFNTVSGTLTAAEERTLGEELRHFRTHGVIIIPDALVGEQLARAQRAYDRVLASARGEWEAADTACRGPFGPSLDGSPSVFELESDLLGLIEVPRVLPLLSQCIGEDLQVS